MIKATLHVYLISSLLSLIVQVTGQLCYGMAQYDRCSSNPICRCLLMPGVNASTGICVMHKLYSNSLVSCQSPQNWCYRPGDVCVQHPLYSKQPVCFPKSKIDPVLCPEISSDGYGNGLGQLNSPMSIRIDDDQTVIIVDTGNHRIVEYKHDAVIGRVVAGGNGEGSGADQLNLPSDIVIDKQTNSLIICDRENRRLMRWSRESVTTNGELLIDQISCYGLAMDSERNLYVTDESNHEVRRYRMGETIPTIVAGGNGEGDRLDQLNFPAYIFVDKDHSIYVSSSYNHHVMKWLKNAKTGTIVAGDQDAGSGLTQLQYPQGVFVDALSTLYIVDTWNDRLVRWHKGATEGEIIVNGNDWQDPTHKLNVPMGLSFDRKGNIYIADQNNHRVQRYSIETS